MRKFKTTVLSFGCALALSAQASLQVNDPQGILASSDNFLGQMPYEQFVRVRDTVESQERHCSGEGNCSSQLVVESISDVKPDGYWTYSVTHREDGTTIDHGSKKVSRASFDEVKGNRLRDAIRNFGVFCQTCEFSLNTTSLVSGPGENSPADWGLKIYYSWIQRSNGETIGSATGSIVLVKGVPFIAQVAENQQSSQQRGVNYSFEAVHRYKKAE